MIEADAAVTVRDALEADIPEIQRIYAHHVLHGLGTFEEVPPSVDEMTARFRTLRDGGFPYVLAERGGCAVGYAYAGPFRPRAAYRYALEDSIYVAPEAVGQGVGRALLGELIRQAERLGCRQLVAVIGDSGNAGSLGVHRAFGFQPSGVLKSVGFKHGRWVDVVMMQLPLGGGDTTLPAPGHIRT
ncbi:MAG TPA: GNAT family N-acetyltransferase [Alphaproteobacteria bacterium]|nr:GNAT family N-acetyltransferase [Alphaproteobacteria bacterium]